MPRDHARIGLGIWSDDDFRSLPANAQHLYWVLLTHPELSYCGVLDWRPAKLSGLVGDWTADDVLAAVDILIERLYVLVDETTEEVLVRSFVRRDGLMKQPKMATAMATAHAAVGSVALRGVIVGELQRLHHEDPDLKGWGSEKATALLAKPSVDPSTYPCGKGTGNPSGKGKAEGPAKGSASPSSLLLAPGSSTPGSEPSLRSGSSDAPRRATRAPDHFVIDDDLRAWAAGKDLSAEVIERETERFLDHHRAKGSTFKDWRAAWRTWMSRTVDYAPARAAVAAADVPNVRRSVPPWEDFR